MITKKEIGKEIKSIRIEKKLTVYNVVKNTKVSPQCLKSIEAGETNYTIDALIKVANYIGVKNINFER